MYRSLSTATFSEIWTDPLDTTYEKVISSRVWVLCPSSTNRYFLLKFSPIFTSNITWHIIFWYPDGNYEVTPSGVSNYRWTLFISLHMEYYQSVLPSSSSTAVASATYLGIFTTDFWVHTQYLYLTLPMILLFFLTKCWIHHENYGSPEMYLCTKYLARYTG